MLESQIVAEVDLWAVSENVKALKQVVGSEVGVMAVAKSNGYGHGAMEIARASFKGGADYIGVARFDEAMEIRHGGIHGPVLVFGHTRTDWALELAEHQITQTICSLSYAQALSQEMATATTNKTIPVHIKIDTGMGRLGILHEQFDASGPEGSAEQVRRILALPGLKVTGIYTHFAASDDAENPHTDIQNRLFQQCLDELGDDAPPAHASNGASIFLFPETRHQMVRAGSLVYGLTPPELMGIAPELTHAMRLTTKVVQVKRIPKGFALGYDNSWIAERPSIIATVPLGYGDGYSRKFSNNGTMLVNSAFAPIAGKVCMDMTMLDITDIPGVQVGDEVVIFGSQGEANLPPLRLAETIGTIPEEIIVGLAARVPRMYINAFEAIAAQPKAV